jgi:deoxyribodipyrimidine photo-lyase
MPSQDNMSNPLTVVWFKRDLRLHDHAPLIEAAHTGRVLPLYVVEPDYWRLPDTSYRQWAFLRGALEAFQAEIEANGGTLYLYSGAVTQALDIIVKKYGKFRLVAHMETGNSWTFERDKAVHKWCRSKAIPFTEFQQHGIWRGANLNRNAWSRRWDTMMAQPIQDIPASIQWAKAPRRNLPDAAELGLAPDGIEHLQTPGRTAAKSTLYSFLNERGAPYQRAMSSPVSGETACSRLSAHITLGSLSMREVYQATLNRQTEVAALPRAERSTWPSAYKSFIGRLHWHCHFMQKLEAEPEIEHKPMARIYEGLRPNPGDPSLLNAFENGQTGFPFVDASMRFLRAKGWINFRMRAMLMSFASYNLWLPWQQSGQVLARLFTDYEPGIHWPQCQMQAGETGINAVRIYSPIKQGFDQDPTGAFTREWVPELACLDYADLQEPWTSVTPPKDYPVPIVDYRETTKRAKERIYALRKTDEARCEAAKVFVKHGSRKPRRKRKPRAKAPSAQLSLFEIE